jgi:steroid 5-alpha reductase family enzyme
MLLGKSKTSSFIYIAAAYAAAFFAAWSVIEVLPDSWSLLARGFSADISATVVIFLFSIRSGNSSVYDAYWSVAPPILIAYWIMESGLKVLENGYFLVFFAAVLFWSGRLTINWALNWKGLQDEDWRYVGFRRSFPRSYWLVSFAAIHLFPTMMVFMACIPAYNVLVNGLQRSAAAYFYGFSGLVVMLLGTALESAADVQLYRFRKNQNHVPGVITTGLWQYSRHPNYLGEVLFWFGAAVFSLASNPGRLIFLLFPAGMLGLFLFYSIPAMEKKILKNRPDYRIIQETVSPLFLLPRKEPSKKEELYRRQKQ